MNILLVDDEQEILEILSELIKNNFENAQVDTANDGIDAVIAITEKQYDIIITDHMMHKMNGAEFVYNLRNIESSLNKNTSVIVLSGFIPQVQKILTEDATILFLSKPYEPEKLMRKIRLLTAGKKS